MTAETVTLVVLGVVMVGVIALAWRALGVVSGLSGVRTRAQERERRDYWDRLERLTEKLSDRALTIHAQERANQVRAEVDIEKTNRRAPPAPPAQDEYCTPEEALSEP